MRMGLGEGASLNFSCGKYINKPKFCKVGIIRKQNVNFHPTLNYLQQYLS